MTSIKAIETEYAGHRFQSRLEARWAVFFDHLDIAWRYEDQGFELPSGGRYLPDFYLPKLNLWVEVNGDESEIRREGRRYAEAVHHSELGLLILGPVPDLRLGMPQHFVLTKHGHRCPKPVLCVHIAWASMLTDAEVVDEIGFPCTDLETHSIDLPALRGHGRGKSLWTQPAPVADWPFSRECEDAYIAARSARFEWGASR